MSRQPAATLLGALARTELTDLATVPAVPAAVHHPAPVTDEARQVAARLKLLLGSDGGLIAVAGIAADDGCTQLAQHLAAAMSQIAQFPALLIEGARSEASLDAQGVRAPGLLDVLSGTSDLARAARPVAGGSLFVLPYGGASATLPSLLASPEGSVAMGAIRGRFPYIFADVGEVLSDADGLLLASRADGIVAALRSGVRRRHEVRHFQQELERLKMRLLGAVLTKGAGRR